MQEKVAKDMMKQIKKSQPELFKNANFKYFDVFAIVPSFISLGEIYAHKNICVMEYKSKKSSCHSDFTGRQTVNRLKSFIDSKPGFLNDLQPDLASSKVEEHVIRNAGKTGGERLGVEATKIEVLRRRIRQEKDTLFLIIHDEAHYAPVQNNLTDKLLNSQDVIAAENVVLLQVSATPYCLLTKNSRLILHFFGIA